MAQWQFDVPTNSPSGANSLGFGQQIVKAAGGAIGSNIVRVTIDDGNAGSKTEAIKSLEAVIAYLTNQTWPIS